VEEVVLQVDEDERGVSGDEVPRGRRERVAGRWVVQVVSLPPAEGVRATRC
jgi:hypothetical protein